MQPAAITPDRIFAIGYGFRAAKTLLSAVELGVFTVLAAGPLDEDALRQQCGLHTRGARDFLDALVALQLLDRDPQGRYANAADAARYLDREKSAYVGGLLENLNAREYGMWGSLTAALRTGEAQTGFDAARHFAELYADPKRLAFFVKGMTGATLPVARALAQKFPWGRYRSLIDVGTAQGCVPVQVAQAHAHITGGGFDLAPVRPFFDEYAAAHGLAARLKFHAGDFFQDPLPAADVLVLGRVLHNWNLAAKRMLLEKAYAALPMGGSVIVYERLIDDARRTHAAGLLSSLNMLIMTAGGFDFTAADCSGWMRDAGFRAIRTEPLADDHAMIVGEK